MKAYLEEADVERMECAAATLRDRLLIRFLFRTGCRISEALGLTAGDVDFEEGTVTIQHLKAKTALSCPECGARLARAHTFCPGCGGRVRDPVQRERERRRLRSIPLDGETVEMLREYVRRGGPAVRGGRKLLFGVGRSRAWQLVKECAEKARLDTLVNPGTGRARHVSPHRLRDAFAVMAVQRDDSMDAIRMLQEQLGHASIATTMHYRKVAGQELRAWYDSLWQERKRVDGPATEA